MNKKIILFISLLSVLMLINGCSMGNTPTKKVENFLNNYKNQDKNVLSQLKNMIETDTLMTKSQKETYADIMKKQYKDLTYEIKNEVINDDTATVTAEIEVYDYYKINKESEEYYNTNKDEFMTKETLKETNIIGETKKSIEDEIENDGENETNEVDSETLTQDDTDKKYIEYRLNKLKDAKDRVTYTIDFTLTKVDGTWKINDIDEITRQKIHGLYEY